MRLFGVRLADIESFGRDLEAPGGPGRRLLAGCARSPGSTSTRSRRNCWAIPPAVYVRRPRLDYESHATGLDRNEVGALLVAAGLGTAAEQP